MCVHSLIIDRQKALRCDCIFSNEKTDLEIGVSGLLYIYYHILTHIDVPVKLAHFTSFASTF